MAIYAEIDLETRPRAIPQRNPEAFALQCLQKADKGTIEFLMTVQWAQRVMPPSLGSGSVATLGDPAVRCITAEGSYSLEETTAKRFQLWQHILEAIPLLNKRGGSLRQTEEAHGDESGMDRCHRALG